MSRRLLEVNGGLLGWLGGNATQRMKELNSILSVDCIFFDLELFFLKGIWGSSINLNQASVDLLLSVVSMVPGLIKVVGMLPH